LENNYGLVPQLPMESPTELTNRNHRRNSAVRISQRLGKQLRENNYGLVPQLPTESSTAITDGMVTEITRPKVHACQRHAIIDGIVGCRGLPTDKNKRRQF